MPDPSPSSSRRSPSSCSPGSPFLRLEQGVPDAAIYPAGVESRDAYVDAPEGIRSRARRRRSSSSRTWPATRPTPPTSRALTDYWPRGRRDRRHRPGRGAVHDRRSRRPGSTLSADMVAGSVRSARRRNGRRASTRCSRATSAARRSASMRSARSIPVEPAATDVIPVIRALDPGDGIAPRSAARAAIGHDFLGRQASARPWAVAPHAASRAR